MNQCEMCGKPIVEDARFCVYCGAALKPEKAIIRIHGADTASVEGQGRVQEKADYHENSRKSVYAGELQKCPNCGEILDSFMAVCPSCGYELREVRVPHSLQELSEQISGTMSRERQIQLIRNYVIPNTKGDILEFMLLAASNIEPHKIADSATGDEVTQAWITKFNQAFQKAKMLFAEDPDYEKYQNIYRQVYQKIAEVQSSQNEEMLTVLVKKNFGIVCGVVCLLISAVMSSFGGEGDLLGLAGCVILICSVIVMSKRKAASEEYILGIGSGVLALALSILVSDAVVLGLGGFIVTVMAGISYLRAQ